MAKLADWLHVWDPPTLTKHSRVWHSLWEEKGVTSRISQLVSRNAIKVTTASNNFSGRMKSSIMLIHVV